MYTARLPDKGTFVIRYPLDVASWLLESPLTEVEVGTGRRIHDGWDVAVQGIGPIGNDVWTGY